MSKTHKSFARMTAAELREATKQFDRELPPGADGLPGRPMNAAEHRRWRAARKKMGRPRTGRGVRRVMVSIEAGLLRESDRFARLNGLSRSGMICDGLRKVMGK